MGDDAKRVGGRDLDMHPHTHRALTVRVLGPRVQMEKRRRCIESQLPIVCCERLICHAGEQVFAGEQVLQAWEQSEPGLWKGD